MSLLDHHVQKQWFSDLRGMDNDKDLLFWMKFSVMEVKQHCLSATIVDYSGTTVFIVKMLVSNVIEMRILL
jgi:hypothetical protein